MSTYKGTIVKEGLRDLSVLDGLNVVRTELRAVTDVMKTPWLKHWTVLHVEIPDKAINELTTRLQHACDPNWPIIPVDLENDRFWFVIWADSITMIDKDETNV